MPTIDVFVKWLSHTQLSLAIVNHPWIWPSFESLHFIGLSLMIGCIGLLDLRMLGVGKNLPLGPMHNRMLPFGIMGFAICAFTGIGFFIGAPGQYILNLAFWFKIGFLAMAGLNLAPFYLTSLHEKVEALGPGQDAPFGAKMVASASLFLWLGVIYWGRMLPFVGNAF